MAGAIDRIAMNDVIREFLLETHENLGQLDADLVALEKNPTERSTLARVFRTLHTVKGSAGFLGLVKLQAVAHSAENLLSRLRSGEMVMSPPIATALLQTVDAIRQVLAKVEASGGEGSGDYTELVRELDRLREGSATQPPVAPSPVSVVEPRSTSDLTNHASPADSRTAVADSSVRVDVGLLDKLMTLVGELVLARNQIIQLAGDQDSAPLLGTIQRLNLLTTELQTNVMKTRMQPIGNVWSKFPRVVRDLAVACGKQVRIEMDGQEIELDRTIIEAIRDPLTHIVRNAVDHGIELPAVRAERGKPAEGRLSLHAFHEGGKVIIEITDDGGGIDPVRVRDKAIALKLVAHEAAARMNERELVNLAFLPGFSTAERVTEFSGRGVGMDVVRINIERIGGTVDLESSLGRGTIVRMKIPLTLAIIPALIVKSGGERFAIPQVSLLELVHVEADQVRQRIEAVQGSQLYRLRGNLLPLVNLNRELQIGGGGSNDGGVNMVVLQADDRQFGLVVDAIHDTEEIVVKPLQKQIKNINVYAGATIMGDGRVALILDVLGLAQRVGVVAGSRARNLNEPADRPSASTAAAKQSLLLFSMRNGGRMAVPLAQVARLEEFAQAELEIIGSRDVVQYRGEILPLIHVARALGNDGERQTAFEKASGPVPVVVYSVGGEQIGLIVDRILDIVEDEVVATARSTRPGVLHSAVVQGRVTEFLDVEAMLRMAFVTDVPQFVGAAPLA